MRPTGTAVGDALSRATALFADGKLTEAQELLSAHLLGRPSDLDALFLRAGVFVRLRAWDLAARDLEQVLSVEPRRYECLVMLGLVRKSESRFVESIELLERAASIDPLNPSAFNTMGMCYLSMRQIDKAIWAFRQTVERDPRSGAGFQNLGLALRLAEKRHLALEAFQRAVEYAPENPTNFISLSEQLRRMGSKESAIECLERGRDRHPKCLPILLALASTYGDAQRPKDAEVLFEECTKLEPAAVQAYALWLQDQGRFEDSVEKLSKSIERYANQGLAYMVLAEAKQFVLSNGSPWLGQVEALLERKSLTKPAQMYAWYAKAKADEHERRFQEAMQAFDEANRLAFAIYNAGRPFNEELGRKVTERTMSVFSQKRVRSTGRAGSASTTPIFIVGMVRSGTTLLDQIVSSHSLVKAAGETPFWMEESDRLLARWREGVVEEDLEDLAKRYLGFLEHEAGISPRITDKMPLNFLHLGQIHATFPKAKILHIRRNPIDTCLSIYATHFGGGPHFAYKKENIVFYYEEYLRLMDHWRAVLPEECFFELDYERLVVQKGEVVSQVLEFCGLPFEESCMQHESSSAAITTPSRWQARQPVYTTSVEKWRAYEPWLGAFERLKNFSHPAVRTPEPLS